MSSTQPQQQEGSRRQLRLLLLDAGGVHSLSTITILKRIVNDVNAARATGQKLEPFDMFDMIGGVGTGGLIAIMLGRLRMSLDECEESFKKLCETIYQPKDPNDTRREPTHSNYNPNKFDSEVLEKAVKDMLRLNVGGYRDISLFQDTSEECKVFVSLSPDDPPGFRIFSSYRQKKASEHKAYDTCKLWKVCAATTASAGFFDPVKMMDEIVYYRPSDEYDDPISLVGQEWNEQWPARSGLLINIGSGVKPRRTSSDAVVQQIFQKDASMFNKDMWFRFNLDPSVKDVLKEDYEKFGQIQKSTTAYMEHDYVQKRLEDCIAKICHTYESHMTRYDD